MMQAVFALVALLGVLALGACAPLRKDPRHTRVALVSVKGLTDEQSRDLVAWLRGSQVDAVAFADAPFSPQLPKHLGTYKHFDDHAMIFASNPELEVTVTGQSLGRALRVKGGWDVVCMTGAVSASQLQIVEDAAKIGATNVSQKDEYAYVLFLQVDAEPRLVYPAHMDTIRRGSGDTTVYGAPVKYVDFEFPATLNDRSPKASSGSPQSPATPNDAPKNSPDGRLPKAHPTITKLRAILKSRPLFESRILWGALAVVLLATGCLTTLIVIQCRRPRGDLASP